MINHQRRSTVNELGHFEDGIRAHRGFMQSMLRSNGVHIQHEECYSYTVGLRDIGSPDLIIFGEDREVAEELFLVIYQAVQMKLVCIKTSQSLRGIFTPEPLLLDVSEVEKRRHFFAARAYYGDWDFDSRKVSTEQYMETL